MENYALDYMKFLGYILDENEKIVNLRNGACYEKR